MRSSFDSMTTGGGMTGGRRRVPSLLLVAIIAGTFASASLLAYQVYGVVCKQEEMTTRAYRAYAHFAAWTFSREATHKLEAAMRAIFRPVGDLAGKPGPLPAPGIVLHGATAAGMCHCLPVPGLHFVFRLDVRERDDARGVPTLELAGDSMPSPRVRAWLADTVASRLAAASSEDAAAAEPATIVARVGAGSGARAMLIAYAPVRGPDGAVRAAYGFATDLATLGHAVFPHVVEWLTLLPPTEARGLPNDSVLVVSVTDASGADIYHSRGPYLERSESGLPMTGAFAGLTVHAGVRREFARRIFSGAWTWNRAQLVIGLTTLTAGLVIVSLLQLYRERAAARMRGDFVASVSHELRTPLAQIRMFAEMLRLGWVRSDDERRRSVEIIDQEARRLTHLVENILLFARAERAEPRVTLERLMLPVAVGEVVEAFEPIARARRVTLRAAVTDELCVMADREALRQVLLNLLDNAVKYGPPGQTVTVGAELLHSTDSLGTEARLWVEDRGPGIPRRDRDRVWEPFQRLDRAVESEVTGNGIGLAVVRELVRAQGGAVWIEDVPGGGARFVVTLKCDRDSALGTRHSASLQDRDLEHGTVPSAELPKGHPVPTPVP